MKVIKTTTQNFNSIADKRAEEAKKYLTSDEFVNALRAAIKYDMIQKGQDYCSYSVDTYYLGTPFDPARDMPYVEAAFSKLKAEYSDLNHVRYDKKRGYIILDTQPNTFLRRRMARGPNNSW